MFSAYSDTQPCDKPATRSSRGLSGSLYGPLPPTIHILGNSYKGKLWPSSECSIRGEKNSGMELKALKMDFDRIRYWASRLNPQAGIEQAEARGQLVREVLQSSRTSPTILSIVGHTVQQNGESAYLPAECYENGSTAALGIAFSEMRDLLLRDPFPMPLLLITDFCDCDNILRLPYALRHDGTKSYWEETKACLPSDWPSEKKVLHYAATDKGQEAQEFTTIGGIFTREFCNISPRKHVSLGERSRQMQQGMDAYFDGYEKLNPGVYLEQKHQVYSSHKLDLDDSRPFKCLGFY